MHTGVNIKARTRNVSSVVGLLTIGLNNIVNFAVKSGITNYSPGKNTMFQLIVNDTIEAYDALDEVNDYYNNYIAPTVFTKIPMLEDPSIGQVHDIIFSLRIENGSIAGVDMDITLRLREVPIVPVFVKLFFSATDENVAAMIDSLFDNLMKLNPHLDPVSHRATLCSRLGCTKIRAFFSKETYDICTST